MEKISKEPLILVALPQLGDPNFNHSVVLILHQGQDGAVGIVLNFPVEGMTLGAFSRSQQLVCHPNLEGEPVYSGGPVEKERGWVIHPDDSIAERKEILPGVFLSGSVESLKKVLENGKTPTRLFLGYAGWGPGQLEREMVQGSWLTLKANPEYILFTGPDETWEKVLTDAGIDPNRLFMGGGIH